jgi:hypothetical protein
MDGLNLLAIIAAALAAFFLGGIWYSKNVFGGIWRKAAGIAVNQRRLHSPQAIIAALIFYIVSAFAFAILVEPQPELYYAIKTGAEIGIFFVATSFGINYVFSGRNYKILLIDGSYHILQFVIYGIVLGWWQ